MRPERALGFGAIDTIEWFHFVGLCPVQKQVVLLTGLDLVLDLQLTVTLHPLGLYSHFQGQLLTDNVPLPIRAVLGLFRVGKRLDVNAAWMPPPDLEQIVFGDRLFSIADKTFSRWENSRLCDVASPSSRKVITIFELNGYSSVGLDGTR